VTPFIPDDYEVPEPPGKYMKLKAGSNHFRILSPRVMTGYEGWRVEGKKQTPVRKRVGEGWHIGEVRDNLTRHFWIMAVWNYETRSIQVLELTQSTIQKAIRSLAKDQDWGDPTDYDLVIMAKGEKMDREYSVLPKPIRPRDPAVTQKWQELMAAGFDLERMYDGGDPFPSTDSATRSSGAADETYFEPGAGTTFEVDDSDVPF